VESDCQAQVPIKPWYIRSYQCTRKGKVSIKGKLYCDQHAKMERKRPGSTAR
jgi:hypothetical protein